MSMIAFRSHLYIFFRRIRSLIESPEHLSLAGSGGGHIIPLAMAQAIAEQERLPGLTEATVRQALRTCGCDAL